VQHGLAGQPAAFDLFFRTNPFEGGYAVFAGLENALEAIEDLRFSKDELAYLAGLGLFRPGFIDFLRAFRFRGRVTAPAEGTLVFANEPLLTVEGTLAETQLVETILLTILNFQTLVATKAARVCHAAAGAEVMEFGLRRAQGPDGGLSAARAACIGGCSGTSNALAGASFALPVKGTHAHSWVQAFGSELEAFRAYAATFPKGSILLVDTYDTLGSGMPNAIAVAREMRAQGHELLGVRIDSGDLAYLSREARRMLDEAGFEGVKVVVSNDLDEHVIESVRHEGGRIDVYGVGTRMVTCAGSGGGALGGVYKLVEIAGQPTLKVTGDVAKTTLPGTKRLLRALGPDGAFLQDVVCLSQDDPHGGDTVFDPVNPLQRTSLPREARLVDVRRVVMEDGRRVEAGEPLAAMTDRCRRGLAHLPAGCARLINPHRYKVSISEGLNGLRNRLIGADARQEAE
ncbi:MAG TPA: nicotinate phosphoribosyltransferase, partial [Holophaga sp.]|nr:nicotinate phosphoribosyltransferase [Holophaga sp.]